MREGSPPVTAIPTISSQQLAIPEDLERFAAILHTSSKRHPPYSRGISEVFHLLTGLDWQSVVVSHQLLDPEAEPSSRHELTAQLDPGRAHLSVHNMRRLLLHTKHEAGKIAIHLKPRWSHTQTGLIASLNSKLVS